MKPRAGARQELAVYLILQDTWGKTRHAYPPRINQVRIAKV